MFYVSLNHFTFSGPHNNFLLTLLSPVCFLSFFVLGLRTVFVARAGFKSRVAISCIYCINMPCEKLELQICTPMEVVVEEIGVLEPFCATDHVPKEKQVKLYHLYGNS